MAASYFTPTSSVPPSVHYKQLYRFRQEQIKLGESLNALTDVQWGLVELERCHHISTASSNKDAPTSYRVRICKTCCQESGHIELGTYVDQESAILVNDAFEMMNNRTEKLIVLRKEDQPYLHLLRAKKFDRSKGTDYVCVLDLISEKLQHAPHPAGLNISGSESRKRKISQRVHGVGDDRSMKPRASSPSFTSASEDSSRRSSNGDGRRRPRDKVSAAGSSGNGSDVEGEMEESVKRQNTGLQESQFPSVGHLSLVSRAAASALSPSPDAYELGQNPSPLDEYLPAPQNLRHLASSGEDEEAESGSDVDDAELNEFPVFSRQRSFSFQTFEEYKYRQQQEHAKAVNHYALERKAAALLTNCRPNDRGEDEVLALEALSQLAKLREEEIDVAKSLFELRASHSVDMNDQRDAPDGLSREVEAVQAKADGDVEVHDSKSEEEDVVDPLILLSSSANLVMSSPSSSDKTSRDTSDSSAISLTARATPTPPHHAIRDERKPDRVSYACGPPEHPTPSLTTMSMRRGRASSMSVIERPVTSAKDDFASVGILSSNRSWCASASSEFPKQEHIPPASRVGYIGFYSPEERKVRIQRFLQKRKQRMWTKKVKYDVRKNFADSRVRVKGRFVKKEEEQQVISLLHHHEPTTPVHPHQHHHAMAPNPSKHPNAVYRKL